jgi:hypothetical protein
MVPIKEIIKTLERDTELSWDDSSYGNDLTESCYCEEMGIKVLIPNSDIYNFTEEKFNNFQVVIEGYDDPELATIEDVVKYINNHIAL